MKNNGISRRSFFKAGAWTATGLITLPFIGCTKLSASSNRPGSFQGKEEVNAIFRPMNHQLYRQLLPSGFELPDELQIAVGIVHFRFVTAPLVPYREGYVTLACKHKGQPGVYVLTMPVDDQFANDAGRARGYPKYVADRIELTESQAIWSGQVIHQEQSIFQISVAPDQPMVTRTSGDLKPTVFNLIPVGVGPQISVANAIGDVTLKITKGIPTVSVHPSQGWGSLLKDAAVISAEIKEVTGNWYGLIQVQS